MDCKRSLILPCLSRRRFCPHGKKRGETDERVALSVPEVRRLLHALGESEDQQSRRLRWSRFRRQHQARAQRFHLLRRARQAPAISLDPPAPVRVLGLPALTECQGQLTFDPFRQLEMDPPAWW